MAGLSFPDVNVWLAILMADHVHRQSAKRWWKEDNSEVLALVRFTQLGVLRLLTTAAVMNNRPLSMDEAWRAYDRLYEDERVAFLDEPAELEEHFRRFTLQVQASPKQWADAWLLSFASASHGVIVTFDRALAARRAGTILLT